MIRNKKGFCRTILTGQEQTAANTNYSHAACITSLRLDRFEKETEKEMEKNNETYKAFK